MYHRTYERVFIHESFRSTNFSFSNLVLLREWPDRKPRGVLVVGSLLY